MNRRALDLAVISIAAIALVAMWFATDERPLGFPLDEAWIHMVYGRSLVDHGVLAYNGTVASTGATSPLWVVLVALAHVVGNGDLDRTIVAIYALGALAQLAVVALVARLARALTGSRGAAACAGAIAALCGPLAMSAFSGMETGLAAVLLLAAVLACARRAWRMAGLWLALGAAARPEVATVSAVCFVFAAYATRGEARRARVRTLVDLAWPSFAIGAVIVGYALWCTGRPLSATFYMKQHATIGDLPARASFAFTHLLTWAPPFVTGIGYIAIVGLIAPKRPRTHAHSVQLLPLAAALAFLVASLSMIQPYADFYHLRYLLPAVPLLIVATAVGAHEAGRHGWFARAPRRAFVPIAALCALALVETCATWRGESERLHADTRDAEAIHREIGAWLAAHTDPGAWIATPDAGAIRYISDRPTIDVIGLNTPDFVWTPGWRDEHPVAAVVTIPCWFQPRDPSLVRVVATAHTEHITNVVECASALAVLTCTGTEPVVLEFSGARAFSVLCRPGLVH